MASRDLYRLVWTLCLPTLTRTPMTESSPGISNLWSHCLHKGPGATFSRTLLQGDPFSQPNPTAHVCMCPQVRMHVSTCQKGVGKDPLEERQAWGYRKLAAAHAWLFPHGEHRLAGCFICVYLSVFLPCSIFSCVCLSAVTCSWLEPAVQRQTQPASFSRGQACTRENAAKAASGPRSTSQFAFLQPTHVSNYIFACSQRSLVAGPPFVLHSDIVG